MPVTAGRRAIAAASTEDDLSGGHLEPELVLVWQSDSGEVRGEILDSATRATHLMVMRLVDNPRRPPEVVGRRTPAADTVAVTGSP
jgi:hypothetical protein